MTPEQFKAWRHEMGLSQVAAAKALDLSPKTIEHYDAGRRGDGKLVEIPFTVALACAAIYHKIGPWGE